MPDKIKPQPADIKAGMDAGRRNVENMFSAVITKPGHEEDVFDLPKTDSAKSD